MLLFGFTDIIMEADEVSNTVRIWLTLIIFPNFDLYMHPFIITSPMLSWRAEALDAFSRRIFQWSVGFFLWAGSNKNLKPQHSRDSHNDDSVVFGFLYLTLCILKKRPLVNDSNNFPSKICLFYLLHLSWINLTQCFFPVIICTSQKEASGQMCDNYTRPWWSIKSTSQFIIFTIQCSCCVYVCLLPEMDASWFCASENHADMKYLPSGMKRWSWKFGLGCSISNHCDVSS